MLSIILNERLWVCMVQMMTLKGNVFWDELVGLVIWWEVSWYIGGDFSVVHYPCERSRDTRQSQAMLDFSEFIFK